MKFTPFQQFAMPQSTKLAPDEAVATAGRRGFTIVELLVVIVVIAILATISVIAYQGIQKQAHESKNRANFRQIEQALEIYRADNGHWPVCPGGTQTYSECHLQDIEPLLAQTKRLPDTGMGIEYIARDYTSANTSDRWAVRFRLPDGDTCKVGRNVLASWWFNIPYCW